MATLLDSLTSLASPAVGQIADKLGESNATVSHGLQASFASVLGGLITKTKDPTSFGRIFDLLNKRPAGADVTTDVQSVVSGPPGAPASGPGGMLLDTLFGAKTSGVGALVARTAGLKNPTSGASLLAMAAPLVLGVLGKKVRENGMSLGGLTTLLVGERESILAAAPGDLSKFVEGGVTRPRVEGEALRGAVAAGRSTVEEVRKSGGNKWLWPAIGIAALALIWFGVTRNRAASTSPAVRTGAGMLDTVAQQAGEAVQTAAGEVSKAVSGLGAFVTKRLPDGVELNVPERGIESKLLAFIGDKSRPVNDTTWFDFDRLNFASGSATILPTSKDQVQNIVAMLKAYPNVNVKVGGYTDNVGSAQANLQLSERRARAVRQALIDGGIPANRLQAEGYGEEHPVADNNTEEGRARNRRIALKVTKK